MTVLTLQEIRERRNDRIRRNAEIEQRYLAFEDLQDEFSDEGDSDIEDLLFRSPVNIRAVDIEVDGDDILFPNAVIATDEPCPRMGIDDHGYLIEFDEILDLRGMDMSRGSVELPMLIDHDMWNYESLVGGWSNLRTDFTGRDGIGRLVADGRLYGLKDKEWLLERVRKSKTTFFSIGYSPESYINVTEEQDEKIVLQAPRSVLYEGSIVSVPADPNSHRRIRALDGIHRRIK